MYNSLSQRQCQYYCTTPGYQHAPFRVRFKVISGLLPYNYCTFTLTYICGSESVNHNLWLPHMLRWGDEQVGYTVSFLKRNVGQTLCWFGLGVAPTALQTCITIPIPILLPDHFSLILIHFFVILWSNAVCYWRMGKHTIWMMHDMTPWSHSKRILFSVWAVAQQKTLWIRLFVRYSMLCASLS